jgi:hypothetical protein
VAFALLLVIGTALAQLRERGPAAGLRAAVPETAFLFLGTCVFAFEVTRQKIWISNLDLSFCFPSASASFCLFRSLSLSLLYFSSSLTFAFSLLFLFRPDLSTGRGVGNYPDRGLARTHRPAALPQGCARRRTPCRFEGRAMVALWHCAK